jgi:hypothetical protein
MADTTMTDYLYRKLTWANNQTAINDALVAADATILSEGQVAFTNRRLGYRCLIRLSDGSCWLIVQHSPDGEFTVMKSVDTADNRKGVAMREF